MGLNYYFRLYQWRMQNKQAGVRLHAAGSIVFRQALVLSNQKSWSENGGAGQLVICEVLKLHLDESLLDENKKFVQANLELIARLGGDYYCHVSKENLFVVPKPNSKLGVGIDALPASIRNSRLLTGNHLGMLANVSEMPVVEPSFDDEHLKNIFQYYSINPEDMEKEVHTYAVKLLDQNKIHEAWQVLLAAENV